ncbi:MAG: DUF447 family protein [Methanoregulaceae archaeon]|nr:DUF447 family protein [Methanoregulaceae archaeon]
MGLLREGVNEVIATTRENAAPMGIIIRGGKARMVVFRGSHTAEQIEETGWVIANILFDPVLFVRTAFEDLPPSFFIDVTVDGIPMQRLAGAEAWVAFSASVERKTTERLMVMLTLLKEELVSPELHPVNRGFSSIIEATVHATRYLIFRDPELRSRIDHHAAIVRKCGGPREIEALRLLFSYIGD